MDKRYQVFVSSTYLDLVDERQRVIQTLLEADCIPAGMELFPAADEEQFNFIKRIIDDCDYYLLIIGGRYGSVDGDGVSYTEKEYDYALSRGLKVIAFVHSDPTSIGNGKVETDPERLQKLLNFRDRVSTGRLVKPWLLATDLPGLVALSLQKTIKMFPAIGWIRADQATSTETLSELNDARKEIDGLRSKLAEIQSSRAPELPDLASLDEPLQIKETYKSIKRGHGGLSYQVTENWTATFTWREIFAALSPHLLHPPNDLSAKDLLEKSLAEERQKPKGTISDRDFQTIKIQLQALGLIQVNYSKTVSGGMGLFWNITPAGRALMFETRTIRTDQK